MLVSELLTRFLIPTLLTVSVVGLRIAFWWEDRRPSVPAHVKEMRAWQRLSTEQQAAVDAEAIAEGMLADGFDAAVRARAEERGRLAVQRAADINVQYHP